MLENIKLLSSCLEMAERRDLKEGKGHSQTSGAVLQISVAGSDPEFSTCSQKGLSPWPTAGSLWQVGVGLQRLWWCRRGVSARNQGEAALRIAGPVHFLPYVRPLHSSPTIFFHSYILNTSSRVKMPQVEVNIGSKVKGNELNLYPRKVKIS